MKKFLFFYLMSILISLNSFAIGLSGKVTDNQHQVLPYATIYVKGTSIGTSANHNGLYQLNLDPGIYEITCQFMGYESQTKTITITNKSKMLDFDLHPQQLKIAEVTIKSDGEDPAYAMMRKVIGKKKDQENLINTLETEIYLKGSLKTRDLPDKIMGFSLNSEDAQEAKTEMGLDSAGKGILYLLEEMAHYYYQKPNKEYHKIISVRESGDPNGLGIATMPPITNIYKNNIDLLGLNKRGFISPAHSNAFLYYKFEFLGDYLEGDRKINKIKIIPKRKFEPLFQGYVYVVDGEWVFHSVELILTRESQIDILDSFKLDQYYRPIDEQNWIIQNQIIYPIFNLFGIEIAGEFLTSYNNQKINQTIDPEVFSDKIISSYDSAAKEKDFAYWDTVRPIPLSEEEITNYHFRDSVYVIQKEKTDSLEKTPRYRFKVGNFILSGAGLNVNKSSFNIMPLIASINYNTVEGLNLSLSMNYEYAINKQKYFSIKMLNRYGFSNAHWNPSLQFTYFKEKKTHKFNSWKFDFEIGQFIYQINGDNPIVPIMNTFYTLFDAKNHMKIYENRLTKFTLDRQFGNGLSAELNVSYDQRMPLYNTTDYTFSEKHDERISSNQPDHLPSFEQTDVALISIDLGYQPGWKYIQYPDYKSPVGSNNPYFNVHYTKGIPGIGNAVSNFDKWKISMRHNVRLRMLGSVDYRLEAGGFLNKENVHIADWKHINGNQTFLASRYLHGFQLAPYYKYSNTADVYFQGHAEWHLGGLVTNKIPLFRQLNWHAVGGSNILYINENDYYAEVFVGVENIGWKMFRFGRIDFIAGYESGKNKPSLGFRLSLGQIVEMLLAGGR